jgi:hypothetical protein
MGVNEVGDRRRRIGSGAEVVPGEPTIGLPPWTRSPAPTPGEGCGEDLSGVRRPGERLGGRVIRHMTFRSAQPTDRCVVGPSQLPAGRLPPGPWGARQSPVKTRSMSTNPLSMKSISASVGTEVRGRQWSGASVGPEAIGAVCRRVPMPTIAAPPPRRPNPRDRPRPNVHRHPACPGTPRGDRPRSAAPRPNKSTPPQRVPNRRAGPAVRPIASSLASRRHRFGPTAAGCPPDRRAWPAVPPTARSKTKPGGPSSAPAVSG